MLTLTEALSLPLLATVGIELVRRITRRRGDRGGSIEVWLGRRVADGFVRILPEDDGGAASIEPIDVIEASNLTKRARGLAIRNVVMTRIATLDGRLNGCDRRGGDGLRLIASHDEYECNDAPHVQQAYTMRP